MIYKVGDKVFGGLNVTSVYFCDYNGISYHRIEFSFLSGRTEHYWVDISSERNNIERYVVPSISKILDNIHLRDNNLKVLLND